MVKIFDDIGNVFIYVRCNHFINIKSLVVVIQKTWPMA